MKAAITARDGSLLLAEVAELSLGSGEVRISVTYCGICGSDLHFRTMLPCGTTMGHEVVGSVVEVADDVDRWSPGDRVVIIPYLDCGECAPCREGHENICEDRQFVIGGSKAPGGYAERVVAKASMLLALPDSIADRTAALVEPLAVALHGIAMAGASAEDPVLIFGGGPIGLLTALALRAEGFDRLIVVEPRDDRRAMLSRAGISAAPAIGPDVVERLGERPRILFDCAGYADAVADGVGLLAPRGRLVLLAATEDVRLPQLAMMTKEIGIASAMFYTHGEFERALALLETGAVSADHVAVTVVPLDDAPAALQSLLERDTPHLKILLQPNGQPTCALRERPPS